MIHLDALVVKVKDGAHVRSKAAYIAGTVRRPALHDVAMSTPAVP